MGLRVPGFALGDLGLRRSTEGLRVRLFVLRPEPCPRGNCAVFDVAVFFRRKGLLFWAAITLKCLLDVC